MVKCKCGTELPAANSFPAGSYCATYCCKCCPDSKKAPCQKELRDGSLLDQLAKQSSYY